MNRVLGTTASVTNPGAPYDPLAKQNADLTAIKAQTDALRQSLAPASTPAPNIAVPELVLASVPSGRLRYAAVMPAPLPLNSSAVASRAIAGQSNQPRYAVAWPNWPSNAASR
jgi:hypothetical protein